MEQLYGDNLRENQRLAKRLHFIVTAGLHNSGLIGLLSYVDFGESSTNDKLD